MHKQIKIKEIKIKKFRYVGHLTITFVFFDNVHYEEKTIKFKTASFLLEKFESKILTDVEFLKRFLQTCHKFGNISVLTKDVCNKHKHYVNSYIFNL